MKLSKDGKHFFAVLIFHTNISPIGNYKKDICVAHGIWDYKQGIVFYRRVWVETRNRTRYKMQVVIEIEDVQIDSCFLNINYHPTICFLREKNDSEN